MKIRRFAFLAGALALLATVAGCGKGKIIGNHPINKPPTIEITGGAVNSDKTHPLTLPYSVTFNWASFDPDGFVDHYVYTFAVGDTALSTGSDTLEQNSANWHSTTEHNVTLQFPATLSSPEESDTLRFQFAFTHPTEFFVAAVDNNGQRSPWEHRYFTAFTVAPTTSLTYPRGGQNYAFTGPTITARWSGSDVDSPDPAKKPVKYFIYFKDITPGPDVFGIRAVSEFMRQTLRVNPIVVDGDTTSMVLKLTVGHAYCLIVKSVDTAGSVELLPTLEEADGNDLRNFLQLSRNVSFFKASPNISGPTLCLQAGLQGKCSVGYDPTDFLPVETPIGVDLQIQWLADARSYGGEIATYRYALDIDDPTAEVPKVTQRGGFTWTAGDERARTAVIPGFPSKGVHYFYVEATDNSGFRSISITQITVVQASFDRPILFILDDPNVVRGRPFVYSLLTKEEQFAYWKDIFETDRYFVDISDTLTYPGGRCLSMAGKAEFLDPYINRIQVGIPLSTLAKYRILVWYCIENHDATRVPALRQMATIGGGAPNNLFTYLQAGGNLWAFGGGIAQQMSTTLRYPITPLNVPQQRANGPFVYDVLGIRGEDTLITTTMVDRSTSDGIDKGGPEYDGRLRALEHWPTAFVRQTASGRESRIMPDMNLDFVRYDTLCDPRQPDSVRLRCPLQYPIPLSQETISGLPDEWDPNPDSSFWQPIYMYRTLGPQAVTVKIDGTNRVFVDRTVTGAYKRGTFLTTSNGGTISAPFQLYYFGVGLQYFSKEDVRSMADIILSTRGWNIWRGSCPANGAQVTLERKRELDAGWQRLTAAQRRQFELETRMSTRVQSRQRSR